MAQRDADPLVTSELPQPTYQTPPPRPTYEIQPLERVMPSPSPAVRCSARRTNGTPCGAFAMHDTTVCKAHGGRAGQVKAAAAERRLDAELGRLLAKLDVAPVENPLEALSLLAGQCVAWQRILAEKVDQLESWRYTAPGAGTEQLRAEVALFERALGRCAHVLGLIAKLQIDERLAKVTQAQATAVAAAVQAAIAHAGVTGSAAEEARAVAARHLRLVASSG